MLGFNYKLYTPHTFRIGTATAAAEKGLLDEAIKLTDRWKSKASQTYITQFSVYMFLIDFVGLRRSIWIVGSSTVRNAGTAVISRPGGQV